MDRPLQGPDDYPERIRGPAALWLLILMIGVILGAAALGAALTADTRDFATRHATVVPSRLL